MQAQLGPRLNMRAKLSDGLVICPVDSPIFSKELLFHMMNVAVLFRKRPVIIVPHFYSCPGHPVYFSHDFFDDLITCPKYGGIRSVISTNRHYEQALFSRDARILLNLNSPSDTEPKGNSMTSS